MRQILTATALGLTLTFALSAQSKPPVTRADYGQWETLSVGGGRGGGGGGFSPDGKWLTYAISRASQTNEARLVKLADNTTKTLAFASQLTFSSDSNWMAYSQGFSEAELERLRAQQRPTQNRVGIMNLATGETAMVDGIQSFTFSPDGAYLVMRRYNAAPAAAPAAGGAGAPGRGGAGPGGGRGGADADPVGGTILVRQLATGKETTFGNVGETAWKDAEHTHLLAFSIAAEGRTGNGVQLFDPETTVLRVIDSSPSAYSNLMWRHETSDLTVLRAKTDERKDGPAEVVLSWTAVGTPSERLRTFDPTTDPLFPKGMRTVSTRRPSWSEDGKVLFLGVAPWADRPAAGPGRAGAGTRGTGGGATAIVDEPAGVDIWHWMDIAVQPRQKLSAAADRRRNMLGVWHPDTNAFVQLGKSFEESITPLKQGNVAYVSEWHNYAMDRTIGRPAADIYLQDLSTGTRLKLRDNVNDRYAQMSPAGKYLFFLQDDAFWALDVATRTATNLTKAVAAQFIDKESDETVKQKPPYGVAGWTKDDKSVLLYDKFDIWAVPTDGSKPRRLTDGASEQVRHRLVRINQDEDWWDMSKPVYVSLFGLTSKKSGYGRIASTGLVDRLIWLDKSVTTLGKARDAEVYSYMSQDYDDSPDVFVGGADLKTAKQITTTNAFQEKYAWGKSETVDFQTDKGLKLQGSLYYPAGYTAGKTYPMIVYLYEKLSDNVHRYVVPSDRDYYNISVFMAQGYFVFEPDIVFRPRQPGLSVVECVTAGVKKVTSMGAVDPKRVGVIGHSWGGFDTAFLATHTNGVFAAAIAGAPITDLISNYGSHHFSSGIAETDHIETGQQRMEVPLYEALPDYIANSAVFNVANMTVPLLIEVGDADGTVFWHQGVELFNIARRAKKNVVLLQYNGEDHGLAQNKNRIDYQQRILAWFGHYLKGDEAAAWITGGESFLDRDAEVRGRGRGGF